MSLWRRRRHGLGFSMVAFTSLQHGTRPTGVVAFSFYKRHKRHLEGVDSRLCGSQDPPVSAS